MCRTSARYETVLYSNVRIRHKSLGKIRTWQWKTLTPGLAWVGQNSGSGMSATPVIRGNWMLTIVSDIHGNLTALEAVLSDIAKAGADKFICLGDVASFGPQPRETLRRVQALDCPVVMGNADAAMLEPPPPDTSGPALFTGIERWCAEQLTDADRSFVRTFQTTVGLELGGLAILCFHGSPSLYNDVIGATTPDEELARFFAGQDATVMCGGHTHTQLLRRFEKVTFVNPGSVGLPFELLPDGRARNPAWAEYALIEVVQGQPSITFRRVPYAVKPLLEAVQTSGMPHAEAWGADWSD